jgi:hypothetical protein
MAGMQEAIQADAPPPPTLIDVFKETLALPNMASKVAASGARQT